MKDVEPDFLHAVEFDDLMMTDVNGIDPSTMMKDHLDPPWVVTCTKNTPAIKCVIQQTISRQGKTKDEVDTSQSMTLSIGKMMEHDIMIVRSRGDVDTSKGIDVVVNDDTIINLPLKTCSGDAVCDFAKEVTDDELSQMSFNGHVDIRYTDKRGLLIGGGMELGNFTKALEFVK